MEGYMTPEELAGLAGLLLSLVMNYVPSIGDWYAGMDTTKQRLVMLALLLVVSVSVMIGNCLGYGAEVGFIYTCDVPGAVELLRVFIAALIANQVTYAISPKIGPVNDRKVARLLARYGE